MKLVPSAGIISCSIRTLPRFRVVRAQSVEDAMRALSAEPSAAVLAGGTDLPARFNEGFAPALVVDISRIDDLRRIGLSDGAIEIGAAVTHAAGSSDPLVRQHLPAFARAWARIANVRVRMSATLGGNLMAHRTRYEGAILLAALGARLRLATAAGETLIAAEECFEAPAGCLLKSIVIPLRKGLQLDYERSMRPVLTQAVALDAAGFGRVVTATEFVRPRVQDLIGGAPAGGVLSDLPFGDPVASDGYIERMRAVFLARQLERMRTT